MSRTVSQLAVSQLADRLEEFRAQAEEINRQIADRQERIAAQVAEINAAVRDLSAQVRQISDSVMRPDLSGEDLRGRVRTLEQAEAARHERERETEKRRWDVTLGVVLLVLSNIATLAMSIVSILKRP